MAFHSADSGYLLSRVEQETQNKERERLDRQADFFLHREQLEVMPLLNNCRSIADFGCGSGRIIQFLAEEMQKMQCCGLDADEETVQLNRKLYQGIKNLKFEVCDLQGDLKQTSCFDFALCRLVLLHLKYPQRALVNLKKFLNPGGRLYLIDVDDRDTLMDPRPGYADELIELLEKAQNLRSGSRQRGRLLAAWMSEAGFQKIEKKQLWLDADQMGRQSFADVFLPVVQAYLNTLLQDGMLKQQKMDELLLHIRKYIVETSGKMALCAWHIQGIT